LICGDGGRLDLASLPVLITWRSAWSITRSRSILL
jgi:hypothetical protein